MFILMLTHNLHVLLGQVPLFHITKRKMQCRLVCHLYIFLYFFQVVFINCTSQIVLTLQSWAFLHVNFLLGIYMLVYSVHFLFITRSCWIIKRKWTTYLLNIFFCLIVDRQKSSILALFVAIITFVREYFPTISTTLHWPIQLQPIYLHHFFFVSSQEHYFLLVECG